MAEFRTKTVWSRLRRAYDGLDSRFQFWMFESNRNFAESWRGFSHVMEFFSVRGWKKWAVFGLSEGFTLGSVALVFVLALAIPAFKAVEDDNWLKRQDLAVTFTDRYGTPIGRRGIRHDDSLTLDDLPEHLVKAALATEDRRFYDHFGIDPLGTLRAILTNARSDSVVQGGSTITQQLAKNLFLTNERSIERKIKEAYLALWLESRLSKREILKLYLDRAYMGGGAFGVQAAAQFYFSKNAKDLNLAEAAMMAGLFKAPTKYAPHVNLPAARARANEVLSNMVEAGFLTEGQVLAARRNPATPAVGSNIESPDYFLDYAFQEVRRLADQNLFGDETSLVVKTSYDPDIQRRTDQVMEQTIRENGEERHISQGAAIIMDPDGAIRAMFGGRDYGESQFNRATNALRQPGSSFKPYVYAAALATGNFTPETRVIDRQTCVGDWCPANYTRSFAGTMTLTSALARSINTIPVQLATAVGDGSNRAGRQAIISLIGRMGVQTTIRDVPSLPLGAVEMTVLDQATGFAPFANGGNRIAAHAALEVHKVGGELLYTFARNGEKPDPVLSADVVRGMNQMMHKVVTDGTGKRARFAVPSAGKTGSTSSYRDIWFVGYTGNEVGALWFGNDDTSPMKEGTTGGLIAAPAWKGIMEYVHQGIDLKSIAGLEDAKPVVISEITAVTVDDQAVIRAPGLSRRSAEAIVAIETLIQSETSKRTALTPVPNPANQPGISPLLGGGSITEQ
jgi:penicillin-binding protein 1A